MGEYYDQEILHVNCNLTIDSLKCILAKYKISINEKWRYERLLRELGEFRMAIWGDRLPIVRRTENG